MLHWLKPLAQTSAACILVAAFAGCAAGLSGGDPARAQAARAEATRLEASGEYAAAARSWLDSAEASRGGQREVALIEAVQAWLLARDWAAARRTLALLPAEGAPALALDRALVEAEVAIKSGEPRRSGGSPRSGDPVAQGRREIRRGRHRRRGGRSRRA